MNQYKEHCKVKNWAGQKQEQQRLQQKYDNLVSREKNLKTERAELEVKLKDKMRSPEAKKSIEHIEKRINQVGREADKKITIIQNEIKDQVTHQDKFAEMHGQIKDRVKDLGKVEITITGPMPMTREAFLQQGRSQVSKLLQNHPAPKQQRGHTQARIADDEDPSKKRGHGLGD